LKHNTATTLIAMDIHNIYVYIFNISVAFQLHVEYVYNVMLHSSKKKTCYLSNQYWLIM